MTDMAIKAGALIPSQRMASAPKTKEMHLSEGAGLHLVEDLIPADLLITEWQTSMQAEGLAERTWTDWAAIVRRAAAATGQHPLAFTTPALSGYLARHRNGNTRSTYYRGLAAFHSWLLRVGHREENPMDGIRPPRPPRGVPHPISTAGLERLLASRLHKRTRTMILLGAYQGLRAAEIATVRAEDLDVAERTLRVLGKGSKEAVLPLHEIVAAAAETMPVRGWWFPSFEDRRRPIRAGSVSLTVSQAMTRAGVRGTAHSLRHWFATALLEAGADAVTVQKLMRHESLATTQIYTRVDFDRMRAAGQRLPRPHCAVADAIAALPATHPPEASVPRPRAVLSGLDATELDALLMEILTERRARETS